MDLAGRSWDELSEAQRPICASERGAFMAPFELTKNVEHPYFKTNEQYKHFDQTPFTFKEYSSAAVPFRWMLRSKAEGEKGKMGLVEEYDLAFHPDIEPDLGFKTDWIQDRRNQLVMLDTFFSALRPKDSLCFFYAKRTPLSEQSGRALIGVGRVKAVSDPVEYYYKCDPDDAPIRCMLWERNVHHSIRPDFKDGFILPYHEVLQAAQEDPSMIPEYYVAFAPDDHWESFSYGSEHVSHDAAISALLSIADVLERVGKVVEGDWHNQLVWVDRELNRLWKMRGPYPGLGSALTAFGLEYGNLVAYDIASILAQEGQEWNEDPWPLVEKVLHDPSILGSSVAKYIGKTLAKKWDALTDERRALLKLISRFDINFEQAKRYYQPTERDKSGIEVADRALLENPYLLYELDRRQVDPIQLGLIDRGVFPDPIVRDKHPLPEPFAVDEPVDQRRVRGFVVDTLERAASIGHTVQPRDWVIQAIRDRRVRPECPVDADLMGVVESFLEEAVKRVELKNGDPAYQLNRLVVTGERISSSVEKRLRGKPHKAKYDWRGLIDDHFGEIVEGEDAAQEERARQEKAVALQELFESRISVLVGPAGTGKTTLLKMLCALSKVSNEGILLLAPTGKARVRLEQQTRLSGGKTIAQFLCGFDRYNTKTGEYLVTDSTFRCNGYKTVVIDESSMLTEEMLASVLDALKGVVRLILVGDTRQLPPIGSGRPFLDIARRLAPKNLSAIFPKVAHGYTELTIRRRQAGKERDDLVLADWFSGEMRDPAADEIWDRLERRETTGHVDTVMWETPEELDKKLLDRLVEELELEGLDDEAGFGQSLGGEIYREVVYFHYGTRKRKGAGSGAENWQILSPVRAHLYGVDSINRTLQKQFKQQSLAWATPEKSYLRKTPKPFGTQGILYGEKVINTRNKQRTDVFPDADYCERYVANGEVGIVVGQYKGQNWKPKSYPWKLEVEFSTQPNSKYGYNKWEFGEEVEEPLELAYALTVHKTQGSEFRITFVVFPNPCWLLSRELLYTAITRQQDKVIIFHQGELRELRSYSSDYHSEMAKRLTNLFDQVDARFSPSPVHLNGRFLDPNQV
ncbi:MAG: AAA family ATPase [Deltaproteobacteria bacterium]|nr:AAA family ATPase [Deltaproteobacteria bacterium]